MILDLGRAGLTNVDDGRALHVVEFYFAGIIHEASPSPDFVELSGR